MFSQFTIDAIVVSTGIMILCIALKLIKKVSNYKLSIIDKEIEIKSYNSGNRSKLHDRKNELA